MASSLSTNPFIGASNSDGSSRFGSLLHSDLRNLSSSTLQFSTRQSHYRKLAHKVVLPEDLVNHESLTLEQRKQNTVTRDKHETELIARGRHDPCVVPRAVPMVESMVALVLVDQLMAQYAQNQLFPMNLDLQESVSKLG